MGRFKSPGQVQGFLSAFEAIRGYCHSYQHKLTATEYRKKMRKRFESWQEVTRQDIAA